MAGSMVEALARGMRVEEQAAVVRVAEMVEALGVLKAEVSEAVVGRVQVKGETMAAVARVSAARAAAGAVEVGWAGVRVAMPVAVGG